jgi:hypothetical protein
MKFMDVWTLLMAGAYAVTAGIGVLLSYHAVYVLYVHVAVTVVKSGSLPVEDFHFWMIAGAVACGTI